MHAICALYKFTRLDDFETIQLPLKGFLDSLSVKGTLLLANSRVPFTDKESRNPFRGNWIVSKSSSLVNLYKAQIACILQIY